MKYSTTIFSASLALVVCESVLADVSVQVHVPESVRLEQPTSFSISISNAGPSIATNVSITCQVPPELMAGVPFQVTVAVTNLTRPASFFPFEERFQPGLAY